MMSVTATLIVRRGVSGQKDETSRYEVPYTPGQSVLDALRWIRAHTDATLAIRYSCTTANTCKECMVAVDGKTVYACTARLEARDMLVEPLPNKALIRDLVTEIAPPDERLQAQS